MSAVLISLVRKVNFRMFIFNPIFYKFLKDVPLYQLTIFYFQFEAENNTECLFLSQSDLGTKHYCSQYNESKSRGRTFKCNVLLVILCNLYMLALLTSNLLNRRMTSILMILRCISWVFHIFVELFSMQYSFEETLLIKAGNGDSSKAASCC